MGGGARSDDAHERAGLSQAWCEPASGTQARTSVTEKVSYQFSSQTAVRGAPDASMRPGLPREFWMRALNSAGRR